MMLVDEKVIRNKDNFLKVLLQGKEIKIKKMNLEKES